MIPRIPFATAIADPNLFAEAWRGLMPEQRAVLKMIYGLPLAGAEVRLWHALHGGATFDELGYPLIYGDSGVPLPVGEADDITFVCGRRATKTSIFNFAIAYEAVCGGHRRYVKSKREQPYYVTIAQDLLKAKESTRAILGILETSPVAVEQLGNPKESVTADSIRLRDTGIITVSAPNTKAIRGRAIAILAEDEVAFWNSDEKAAVPDVEIERAAKPGLNQFPDAKIFRASSPWTKEGLLWKAYTEGTYGRHMPDGPAKAASARKLVFVAPTPLLNPTLSGRPGARTVFAKDQAKDPAAYRRETLAEFADAVSGFLPVDLLNRAVRPGVRRRPPSPNTHYVAALDPAFKRDAFALAIGHMQSDGAFVLDVMESWRGTPEAPLSPRVTLGLVGGVLKQYGVRTVYSDQYHVESLQDLAQDAGFLIHPHPLGWKNKQQMWAEVLTLLNQQDDGGTPKLALLDHEELLRELRQIERVLTPSGAVKISGKADDHAMVLALCVQNAVQYGRPSATPEPRSEQTTEAGCAAVRALLTQEMFRPRSVAKQWYLR